MTLAWDYGAVAFLDILGFASFIEEDAKTLEPKHLERVLLSLQDVKASPAGAKVDLRAFSDSIVLGVPFTNQSVADLVAAAIALQRQFIRRGVLIRGALAFGKHFASPELVYSEAVVKAYRLERSTARFPRVVVDANLLDWFLNDGDTTAGLRAEVTNRLNRDRDQGIFLDYLDKDLLPDHLALLQSYEITSVTPSVLEKLQWLAEYHNHTAEKFDPALTIDTPMLAGFRPF